MYKARGLAVSKAKGEFISFLDVDDWWSLTKLEKQIAKFKNKSVGFVCSNVNLFDQSKNIKKICINNNINGLINLSSCIKDYKIGIVSVVFRKNLLKKLNLKFNPRYKIIGDFDLFVKIIDKTKVYYNHQTLATYRLHENNFTKKNFSILVHELKYWLQNNKSILKAGDVSNLRKKIFFLKIKYFFETVKMLFR